MNAQIPPAQRSLSVVDFASLLFLGAVWGASFLFSRVAAPEVGPAWAAEIRLAVGAAFLLAVAGRSTLAVARGRMTSFLVVGALFAAVPVTLVAFATVTLPAGFTALLNAATPLFTAAIAVGFMGQRMSRRVLAGLGVGVFAVIVLVGWSPLEPGATTAFAIIAGLLAPVSYAVAGNFARARLHGIPATQLATGMVTAGAILALPAAILSGPPRTPAIDGVVSLLAVGILSTAIAWPIFFRVLGRTTPTAASTVTFIVPAFALVWGSLLLSEPVGAGLLVGFGLILLSLTLVLGVVPSLRPPRHLARAAVRGTGQAARASSTPARV